MTPKNSVLLVLPKGGYGVFLNWCLEYFSGNLPTESGMPSWLTTPPYLSDTLALPITSSSNLSFIRDNEIHQSTTLADYLAGSDEYQFLRTVATVIGDPDYQKSFVQDYNKFFKRIVCLTQDQSCHLLILHNFLKKGNRQQEFVDRTILQNKDAFAAADPVPTWQLREMISFEHHRLLRDTTQLYQPSTEVGVINISIRNLIDHFQNTLTGLFDELDIPMTHCDQLDRVESEWLGNEKFIGTDQLCLDIVANTLASDTFYWSTDQLTLIDEAYVQYLLRQHQFELRCYGLDTFPTNSVQLKQLLYSV
jgi:hypothetical protein